MNEKIKFISFCGLILVIGFFLGVFLTNISTTGQANFLINSQKSDFNRITQLESSNTLYSQLPKKNQLMTFLSFSIENDLKNKNIIINEKNDEIIILKESFTANFLSSVSNEDYNESVQALCCHFTGKKGRATFNMPGDLGIALFCTGDVCSDET